MKSAAKLKLFIYLSFFVHLAGGLAIYFYYNPLNFAPKAIEGREREDSLFKEGLPLDREDFAGKDSPKASRGDLSALKTSQGQVPPPPSFAETAGKKPSPIKSPKAVSRAQKRKSAAPKRGAKKPQTKKRRRGKKTSRIKKAAPSPKPENENLSAASLAADLSPKGQALKDDQTSAKQALGAGKSPAPLSQGTGGPQKIGGDLTGASSSKGLDSLERPEQISQEEENALLDAAESVVSGGKVKAASPDQKAAAENGDEGMEPEDIGDWEKGPKAVAAAKSADKAAQAKQTEREKTASALKSAAQISKGSAEDIELENIEWEEPPPKQKTKKPPEDSEAEEGGREDMELVEDDEDGEEEKPERSVSEPLAPRASGGKAGASQKFRNFKDLRQKRGNPPLSYPEFARRKGMQGTVSVIYFITKDGLADQIQVESSSGHLELDNFVIRRLARYEFLPGQEGWTRHKVKFRLEGVERERLRLREKN